LAASCASESLSDPDVAEVSSKSETRGKVAADLKDGASSDHNAATLPPSGLP
jgi:hypothetical protein